MNRAWRRHALWILGGAIMLAPAVAFAEPTAADRETARALVINGRARLNATDYQGAYRAFKAAHEIMGVPTTGLDLAKALDGLGLLIEARATALDVARMPPKPAEPQAFTDARTTAATLADQIAERIPSVVISVTGIGARVTPRVTVDGAALSSSLLTLPRKINPGAHIILAAAPGYTIVRRTVMVQEGATVPVEITMIPVEMSSPEEAPEPLPPVPVPARAPAPAPAPRPTIPSTETSQQRIAGLVVSVAGLLGVGVGAAFGGVAIAKNDASKRPAELAPFAPPLCDAQNLCDAAGKALRDEAFQAATISSVGFIAGGILLTGGVIMVLTAPSAIPAPSVALGPGSISLIGKW